MEHQLQLINSIISILWIALASGEVSEELCQDAMEVLSILSSKKGITS